MTAGPVPSRAVRLCLVADDFGLDPSIDAAILDLVERGRVHALGCLTGSPQWRASAQRLRSHHSVHGIDIGLHLDFTEHPLTVPRRTLSRLIVAAWLRRLSRRDIRDEICAQLLAFEDELGRAPAYVDGHQHIHQFPVIRDELLEELERRYAGAQRPWLRDTQLSWSQPEGLRLSARDQRKARLIETLGGHAFSALARSRGFGMNAGLLGVYGFDRDARAYAELLGQWLACAQDGALLMCHPACELVTGDAIARARVEEYAVLTGPLATELIDRWAIVLQPMSRIIGMPRTSRPEDRVRTSPAGSGQTHE